MLADVTIVTSLVGALAPVLTALLFIPVRILMKRLERNHDLARAEGDDLRVRLGEAEGAIRGDLKDGLKNTSDRIEAKVDAQNTAAQIRREAG